MKNKNKTENKPRLRLNVAALLGAVLVIVAIIGLPSLIGLIALKGRMAPPFLQGAIGIVMLVAFVAVCAVVWKVLSKRK